jgi:nitrate/nitrite-specific signal transduction histidine kinase
VLNGLQGLTLLRDIEVRVYDLEDEDNHQEFTCHSDMSVMTKAATSVHASAAAAGWRHHAEVAAVGCA